MNFPITVIDDFYDNPQEIVKFAQSLPYDHPCNGQGIWFGNQTKSLHEIDPIFFETFCKKLFSIFFDFSKEPSVQWQVDTRFSKIPRINNNIADQLWIHQDEGELIAGVIYLNDVTTSSGGTSIYHLISEYEELDLSLQKEFYTNPEIILDDSSKLYRYKQLLFRHFKNFRETTAIKNTFNRMVCYDANNYHNIKSVNVDDCDYRLTQVFFVRNLQGVNYPVSRSKQIFEPNIKRHADPFF